MVGASENIYVNESEIIHSLEASGARCGHSDGEYVKKSSCTAAAVFLGLLCLLLLAGLMTLYFFFRQGNSEWDERMVQLHNNLTKVESRQQDFLRTFIDRGCECWRRVGTSFYYVSTEQRTWQESRDQCKERGADLVIINSKEEQEFLIGLKTRVWIGLTDQDEDNVWEWVDGTKLMNESYWGPSQPDNHGDDEDCVEIRITGDEPLVKWNDLACSYKNKWICETNYV